MGYEPLFQCVSCISLFSLLAVVDVYPGVGAAVKAGQQHDDGKHWTCERKRDSKMCQTDLRCINLHVLPCF